MKKIGTFLIAVALVVGMVGCNEIVNEHVYHQLAVSSTSGGSVIEPGEGVRGYEEGTVVDLVAEPDVGHRFVEWTGDVGTIANVYAASTTITVNGDYSITASFVARYTLTIDSTDGGHVANPGDGTYTYDAGTVVDLVAEAWEGYKFLNWTGDVNTVDDADAGATTVTMEGNYTITAGFLEAHLYLDQIGPGLWGEQSSGEGVKVTVTDEGVVVSFASDQEDYPGAVFGGGGYSLFALQGDFDVRMGYELTTWPHHSGVRVGLIVLEGELYTPDRFANIERTGFGEHDLEFSFPGEPAEVYLVNFDDEVSGLIGTDDLAGTLRVSREGDMLTGYYETSEGWDEIYKAEWSTGNVIIRVFTWSSGHTFGGEEVGVLLRTVEIVGPAS